MNLWVETCIKCKTQNAVSLGDPSDYTIPDVTGIECYSCGHIIRPDWSEEFTEDELTEYVRDGKPLSYYSKGN